MKTLNRKNLPKIGIWLVLTYIWGYLGGAVVITAFIIPSIILGQSSGSGLTPPWAIYVIGLIVSFEFFILMAPVFLLSLWMWLIIAKKYPELETTWRGVILYTFLIGLVSGLIFGMQFISIFSISHISFENFSLLHFLIGFFGGWIGTLMPRILIKKLRPGSFM